MFNIYQLPAGKPGITIAWLLLHPFGWVIEEREKYNDRDARDGVGNSGTCNSITPKPDLCKKSRHGGADHYRMKKFHAGLVGLESDLIFVKRSKAPYSLAIAFLLIITVSKLLFRNGPIPGKRRDRAGQIRDKVLFNPQLLLIDNILEPDNCVNEFLVIRQANLFIKPVPGFPGTIYGNIQGLGHIGNAMI